MPDFVLDPNPASTIEASDEYKAAWFAAYGTGSPDEPLPPPPDIAETFVIDEAVLPDYLKRDRIDLFIEDEVAQGLVDFHPVPLVREYHFVVAATEWVCDHDLGVRFLDVVTVDTNGDELIGDLRFDSDSRVVIEWSMPQTGTARLST